MKPQKKHFIKWLRGCNAGWINSINECIVNCSKGVMNRANSNEELAPHYPSELAIRYGLKNGLIECFEDNDCRFDIYFTEDGLEHAKNIAQTTCAFTGRMI